MIAGSLASELLFVSRLAFAAEVVASTPAEESPPKPTASRGFDVLRTHRFLPPDFDQAVFDALWTAWPEPERSAAEQCSDLTDRRRMIRDYYGLVPDPSKPDDSGPGIGYVTDGQGHWTMSCLACHAGSVQGQIIPGLPNTRFAMQTLTEDVRLVKLLQRKPLSHLDLAIVNVPLNETNGTTNSVIFGVILGTFRLPDMSVDLQRKVPPVVHHDMDAPPFWNVKFKSSLYADGFSPRTHRPLMQFMLLPSNSKETVYNWETDFRDIQAWIESVPVPASPLVQEPEKAERGRLVFDQHCARCHGTYGPRGSYTQRTIPWEEVQTDKTRLEALTPAHRQWMKEGWMSRYGADPVVVEPTGYVAPPLHGLWASAPYFHNGSVPTLWHVLHPESRPVVWKRTDAAGVLAARSVTSTGFEKSGQSASAASGEYDVDRVGLRVETADELPASVKTTAARRRWFDTRLLGKSARGHDFPQALSESERDELLEYLKGL